MRTQNHLGRQGGIALICAIAPVCLLSACNILPTTKGGDAKSTLGQGVSGTVTQPENPAQSSSQQLTRAETTWYAPAASAWPQEFAWPSGNAPTPPPVPVARTVTESASTQIGAAQDVAGVLKAAQSHYKSLVSVIFGAGLCFAGWRAWKAEWPVMGSLLALGGVLCIIFLNFWIGLGASGAGLLLYVGYHFAKPIA